MAEFDGSFFRSLSLNDTFQTAASSYSVDDDMEIDNEYETANEMDTHTPEPMVDEQLNASSTPFDWNKRDVVNKLDPYVEDREDQEDEEDGDEETGFETAASDPSALESDTTSNSHSETFDSLSAISLSILLPTTLGAKYALDKRQKLLMPPPPKDGNQSQGNLDDLVDSYDFDVSNSISPITKVRNITTFSSSSDPSSIFAPERTKEQNSDEEDEFTYNPKNGEYVDHASASGSGTDSSNSSITSVYNNRPSSFIRSRPAANNHVNQLRYPSVLNSPSLFHNNLSWNGSTPIQVHHHHYYSSPQSRDMFDKSNNIQYTPMLSPSNEIRNSRLTRMSPGKHSIQEKLQLVQTDEYSKGNYSLGSVSTSSSFRDDSSLIISKPELPAPWQSNSSPHEKITYILSSYVQLFLNVLATGYASYLFYSMIRAVRSDISIKVQRQMANTLIEMESCKRKYYLNNCEPDKIVPGLEEQCTIWLKCMHQNPDEGGGNMSMISAEHFGMILNSLIEPLGLKFFSMCTGFVFVLFSFNFIFGYFRAKAYYGWEEGSKSEALLRQK